MGFYGIYIFTVYTYIYILRFLYHFFDSMGRFHLDWWEIYGGDTKKNRGDAVFRSRQAQEGTEQKPSDSEAPVVPGEAPAVPTARQGAGEWGVGGSHDIGYFTKKWGDFLEDFCEQILMG